MIHVDLRLFTCEKLTERDHHQQGQVPRRKHRINYKQVIVLDVAMADAIIDPCAVMIHLNEKHAQDLEIENTYFKNTSSAFRAVVGARCLPLGLVCTEFFVA